MNIYVSLKCLSQKECLFLEKIEQFVEEELQRARKLLALYPIFIMIKFVNIFGKYNL